MIVRSVAVYSFLLSSSLIQRLLQDSVARLTCALPLNLLKSMIHDLYLKVTEVYHDGSA